MNDIIQSAMREHDRQRRRAKPLVIRLFFNWYTLGIIVTLILAEIFL